MIFKQIVRAITKTGDYMLAYQFQKDMMKQRLLSGPERERLIEDVAREVLSRISVTVDAEDVIREINGLWDAIRGLGK